MKSILQLIEQYDRSYSTVTEEEFDSRYQYTHREHYDAYGMHSRIFCLKCLSNVSQKRYYRKVPVSLSTLFNRTYRLKHVIDCYLSDTYMLSQVVSIQQDLARYYNKNHALACGHAVKWLRVISRNKSTISSSDLIRLARQKKPIRLKWK